MCPQMLKVPIRYIWYSCYSNFCFPFSRLFAFYFNALTFSCTNMDMFFYGLTNVFLVFISSFSFWWGSLLASILYVWPYFEYLAMVLYLCTIRKQSVTVVGKKIILMLKMICWKCATFPLKKILLSKSSTLKIFYGFRTDK